MFLSKNVVFREIDADFRAISSKNADFKRKIGRGDCRGFGFRPFLFFLIAAVAAFVLIKIQKK